MLFKYVFFFYIFKQQIKGDYCTVNMYVCTYEYYSSKSAWLNNKSYHIRIEYGIRCLNLEKTVNAFVASETSYS
jgi:hypothetical protein